MSWESRWRSDHRLTTEQAAAVIAEQFPELAPVRAEELGEGWDGVVLLVNGAWAFRFPKRAEVEEAHDRERALLAALAPRLPLPIPVPVFLGRRCDAFPLRFAGYRLIPGVGADVAPEPSRPDDVARVFGGFLAALHAFPADEARALVLEEHATDWTRLRAAARESLAATEGAVGVDLARRCLAVLDDESLVPAAYAGPPRLIHGDLGIEHLVVAPDGSRVEGVIDWADAHLGDPAADYEGLWQWAGTPLLERAARAAGQQSDLVARARYAGFLVATFNVRYGVEGSRPHYVTAGVRALTRGVAELRP